MVYDTQGMDIESFSWFAVSYVRAAQHLNTGRKRAPRRVDKVI